MPDAELENRKALLRNSVLGDLPPEELGELARAVQSRFARPSEFIFTKGDPADALYIIGSGRVRLFIRRQDGTETDLCILGPGEHFGEAALPASKTLGVIAESLAVTHLMVVPKERFDRLLKDYPDLYKKFARKMRGRLLKYRAVFRPYRVCWFDFLVAIGVSVLLAIAFNTANPFGIPLVPVRPAAAPLIGASMVMEAYLQGQTLIVDAMPNNFYRKRHIEGAVNMPVDLFDIMYQMNLSREDKDKRIVVYGNTISRPYDLEIAGKLLLRGYRDVQVLDGGLAAWEAKGYPVN